MLCVIAKLDDAVTNKLDEIRKAAFPDGRAFRPLHGHITIATYTGEEEAGFIQFCRKLLNGVSAFSVEYRALEVLEATSIIIATPEKSGVLESLHQSIAERYENDLDKWTRTELWYPHTTLLYDPQTDLHAICRQMSERFAPFSADIRRIEFSRVLETGYEIIDHVDLLNGARPLA